MTVRWMVVISTALMVACGGSDGPKKQAEKNDGASNNGSGTNNGMSNNGARSNNSASNNGASNNGASNNGASNNGASNNGVTIGCEGCVGDNVCRRGDVPEACGTGGEACVACTDGRVCSDGACVEPAACGPDNCQGCCDASGECQTGSTDSACGMMGASCEICTGTEACSEGVCERPCEETCDGCCRDGVCLVGNQDSACGTGGEQCASCGTNSCDSGQCVALDCATTCNGCCDGSSCNAGTTAQACGSTGDACVACQSGQSCSNGACVTAPDSRWELILISGTVSTTNPMGDPWDYIGSPDPVVTFGMYEESTMVNYTGTSSIVQDDSTPTWNEAVVSNVPASAFMNITMAVYDSDLDFDDYICGSDIDLRNDLATYNDLFTGATYRISCVHPDNSATFANIDVRLQPMP